MNKIEQMKEREDFGPNGDATTPGFFHQRTELTVEQMTREVYECLHPEGCWHEWAGGTPWYCSKCALVNQRPNPEYASPAGRVLLLQEMMKRKDFNFDFGFQQVIGGPEYDKIDINYITDDTGKLLKAVWEWMRKGK
jgi:hypothetical protein